MSDRDEARSATVEDAARTIVGPGVVVHRKPLTVVATTGNDIDRLAEAADALVDQLIDDDALEFGPVAAGLQQLVVDHQPDGVAAVLDIAPDSICFLFDRAVAFGQGFAHQARGRADWTTVFLEGQSVTLVCGDDPTAPPVGWSRLLTGTVPGRGAEFRLSRRDPQVAPEAPVATAPPTAPTAAESDPSLAAMSEPLLDPLDGVTQHDAEAAPSADIGADNIGADDMATAGGEALFGGEALGTPDPQAGAEAEPGPAGSAEPSDYQPPLPSDPLDGWAGPSTHAPPPTGDGAVQSEGPQPLDGPPPVPSDNKPLGDAPPPPTSEPIAGAPPIPEGQHAPLDGRPPFPGDEPPPPANTPPRPGDDLPIDGPPPMPGAAAEPIAGTPPMPDDDPNAASARDTDSGS